MLLLAFAVLVSGVKFFAIIVNNYTKLLISVTFLLYLRSIIFKNRVQKYTKI